MFVDGVQMGDPLTDNAYKPDGYRFHDVFHLACAAVLGWSPVVRKLLGRKRRSQPELDEIEDGGRAIATEEGISALVFAYARDHNWLEGVTSVDYDILKGNSNHDVEPRSRPYARQANGSARFSPWYHIWKQLQQNQGGKVALDLDKATIVRWSVAPPTAIALAIAIFASWLMLTKTVTTPSLAATAAAPPER